MKKILVLKITFCFFFFNTLHAQVTFQKTFTGGAITQGYCVHQTTDGGYIISGTAENIGAGIRDVYLIKTDATGDTLWTQSYGGTSYDEGFSVEQTSDGGYIITGYSNSFGTGADEVYLIKTNALGVTLWTKTYGGNLNGQGNSVKQTTDGGYIIAGNKVDINGIRNVLIIKTDAVGDTLWTKNFGGTGDDYGYAVTEAIGGGFVISGNYSTGGIYLIKTSVTGDTLWTKAYIVEGPPHINGGLYIQQTTDSGFIISGIAYGATGVEGTALKTDNNGNWQWSKTYSGVNHVYINCGKQTTDGGYIFSGWSQAFPNGTYHSLLIRTDANGDTLWTRTYGGGDSHSSVQQTADGGFVLLAVDNFNIYLIKTDSLGNSGCSQGNAWPVVSSHVPTVSTPSPVFSLGGTVTVPATVIDHGGMITTLCLECNLTVTQSGLPDSVCLNGTSSNLIGSPSGGTFIGAGISGNIFNPSIAGLGLHTVIYLYSISPECNSSDTVFVFVKSCINSIDELNNKTSFIIYPNPADEFLFIKNTQFKNENVTVKIFDVSGREIYSSLLKTSNLKIETKNLSDGIYFCQLITNEKTFNQKFLVQH